MKKIATRFLSLSLCLGSSAFADTVYTGATTASEDAVPNSYHLLPYITVSTSPYIAESTAYDASDIWSQQSTMNEDLFLLQYRQSLEKELVKSDVSLAQRPILEISGAIEGLLLQTINNFSGESSGDINLNTAELDFNAMVSRWATAFMSIEFDDSPPETGSRVTNSRLYLRRGFAVIGNLDVSPVYFSIGQMYAPFGRYSSTMLTAPLTLSLARINDRAAVLGYYKDGIYLSAYAYSGINSNAGDAVFNNGGVNGGVKIPFLEKGNITIGAGAISDMTASQGMSMTGASAPMFPGFTEVGTGSTYPFVRKVPGADAHTEISYGPWSFAAEFISATRNFAMEDMTFNGQGAEPRASHLELQRDFVILNQTVDIGTSYGHSWQALALNLPQNSFTVYARTSFWKNTVEQIEFRHDDDYSTKSMSTAASNFGVFTNMGTGKSRDLILAQLGVYF